MQNESFPIVLASASLARQQLLRDAGVSVTLQPASIDEAAIKRTMIDSRHSADDIALALAGQKAEVAESASCMQAAIVVGADQILVCEGAIFDKPRDRDEAGAHLRRLRGRWHTLHTAIVCRRNGQEIWRHVSHPCLRMRDFSDAWLDRYRMAEGDALLHCVGAYRLEGLGSHLFTDVVGDHPSILGLPILPLFGFLREIGALDR
jgi:septum formation protein